MRHATHVDACLDDVCLAVHDFCLGTSSQQAAQLASSVAPMPVLRVALGLARVPKHWVFYFGVCVDLFSHRRGHAPPQSPSAVIKRAKLVAQVSTTY